MLRCSAIGGGQLVTSLQQVALCAGVGDKTGGVAVKRREA
jgi:hypothetical protein